MSSIVVVFVPLFIGITDVPRKCVDVETMLRMRYDSMNIQLRGAHPYHAKQIIEAYEKDFIRTREEAEACLETQARIKKMTEEQLLTINAGRASTQRR